MHLIQFTDDKGARAVAATEGGITSVVISPRLYDMGLDSTGAVMRKRSLPSGELVIL